MTKSTRGKQPDFKVFHNQVAKVQYSEDLANETYLGLIDVYQ
jgi:hypothetical protein